MYRRAEGSRLKLWILLEPGRWLLTAAILALVFGSLVLVGSLSPVSLGTIVGRADPVSTLFQALVTAIITGVTVVVTITQLVLSQELGPLGDQRERMEGAMSFRADTEDLLDEPVTPLEPSTFIASLLRALQSSATALHEAATATADDATASEIRSFADRLRTDADRVADSLDGATFGTFDVLSPALGFEYATRLYDARRFRREYESALPASADGHLVDLVDLLSAYGVAREHFKTLYFQWQLTNLSRQILYVAVPALLVAIAGVLYLDAGGTVAGTTLGVDNLVWVVSGAVTVSVAPFALLVAYVLRIATVAKRTLSIGPFALREVDRTGAPRGDEEG